VVLGWRERAVDFDATDGRAERAAGSARHGVFGIASGAFGLGDVLGFDDTTPGGQCVAVGFAPSGEADEAGKGGCRGGQFGFVGCEPG